MASFKKTVAMHEVFLCRLAAHPTFSKDPNFRVFLEYESDVSRKFCLIKFIIFARLVVGSWSQQEGTCQEHFQSFHSVRR